MFGFECTLGVASIDETIAAVEANGGKIVMPKFHIPTVGTLIFSKTRKETLLAPCNTMRPRRMLQRSVIGTGTIVDAASSG